MFLVLGTERQELISVECDSQIGKHKPPIERERGKS